MSEFRINPLIKGLYNRYCAKMTRNVSPIVIPFLPHFLGRALFMRRNYLSSFKLADFRRSNNHRGCRACCHGDPPSIFLPRP